MVRKSMSLDSAPVKELRKSDRVAVVEVQGRRARIIKDDFEGWVSLKTKHGDPIFQRCQWPHEKDTKHAFAVTFDKKWKAAQEAKADQAEKDKIEAVEEKFPKENFRVNGEMREKILVYESILMKFWSKMNRNARKIVSKFGF